MLQTKRINRRIFLSIAITAVVVPILAYGALGSRSSRNSQAPARLEVELITVRPAGCEPNELIRPKGSFVLMIDDRSGKENLSLVLQRKSGEQFRTVNLNRRKSEWHEVLDLPPGSYVLQDTNESERRCRITILP